MDFRYTRRQVARGARPDAGDGGRTWILLKLVSELRLTYQIRLLTFGAGEQGRKLIIKVPRKCRISAPLRDFLKEHKSLVKLERVD